MLFTLYNTVRLYWGQIALSYGVATHLDKALTTITMKHNYRDTNVSKHKKNKVYIPSIIDTSGLKLLTCKSYRAQNSKIQKLLPRSSQGKK